MAQHRWSIPFVGGYTYIQSDEEFNQSKENAMNKLKKIRDIAKSAVSKTIPIVVGAAVVSGRALKGVAVNLKHEGETYLAEEKKDDTSSR